MLELLVCIIFMPPYIDASIEGEMQEGTYMYSLDGILLLLTMCKSYLLFRVYNGLSCISLNQHNKTFYQHFKYQANYLFTLRSDIKYIPFIIITFVFLAIDMYGGLFLLYSERSYIPSEGSLLYTSMRKKIAESFKSLADPLWLGITSIIAVGYGDLFP